MFLKEGRILMEKKVLFDENFVLLEEMYLDPYFPVFLVDKIKDLIVGLIKEIESGKKIPCEIQKELDRITLKINDLEDEFFDNNSEIETLARESIALTIGYILSWYDIRIDIEDALRLRTW